MVVNIAQHEPTQQLPETLVAVLIRLEQNPELVKLIRQLFIKVFNEVLTESKSFTSFFEFPVTPNGLEKALLKIFNVTEAEFFEAFRQIGFSELNRMHKNPYYLTLTLTYYYGVLKDDDILKDVSIVFMLIKLYRGRYQGGWPSGHDEVTLKHIQSRTKSNSIISKYPNSFDSMYHYHAPNITKKYSPVVIDKPAHPKRGLYSILTAAWTRVDQQFTIIRNKYFKAYKNGVKTAKNNEMTDRNTHTITSALVDKIYKMTSLYSQPIPETDKAFIKGKFVVKDRIFKDFDEYVSDAQNETDVKNLYETVLTSLAYSQNELANMNIILTSDKLTSEKVGQPTKDQISGMLQYIYKDSLKSLNDTRYRKLRKAYLIIFLIKLKSSIAKSDRYITTI